MERTAHCRKCGCVLKPLVNWSPSRIKRYDYVCTKCNARVPETKHWDRHRHKITGERIGFLDIEATSLKADFGITLCYCIADRDSKKIYGDVVTKKDLTSTSHSFDKRILVQFLKDITHFDRFVTYYGTGFDFPFLRTRCLYHKLGFPDYGDYYHTDVYYIVKHRLRLSRRSLDNALKMIVGKSDKTHYGRDYWIRAMTGEKKALDYIYDHCRRDVTELKKLYDILEFQKGYSRRGI